jgi:hypothetical protein
MNITDELERLSQLRADGALNDAEFAAAKARLLDDSLPAERSGGRTLGEAANRYVSLQMVMAVVGVVVFLIFLFKVMLPSMQQAGFPGFRQEPVFQMERP